jgi:hypothetical protein
MINLINKLLFLLHLPLITKYSPYSREERNKIYKEALKDIDYFGEIPFYSLCYTIGTATVTLDLYFSNKLEMSQFPELFISKPLIFTHKYGFWWNSALKEPRIKALEGAIKLTE